MIDIKGRSDQVAARSDLAFMLLCVEGEQQIASRKQWKIMHLFSRSAKIFTLVLLGGAFAVGQQPSPVLPSQSGPKQTQTQVTRPADSSPGAPNLPVNNGLAQPPFLTEVYGLQ